MLKKILIAFVVILALFLIFVALQPAHFVVQRSTTISAPAEAVFAQVNDFHNWTAWSPWEKIDPAMKRTYSGAPSGIGTIYAWSGNDKAGEGSMQIVESHPNDNIRMKLDFVRPFAATNNVEFTFKPTGRQTAVTWSMDGEKGFIAKGFCLFMDMDKMVGGDFERGLAQLKTAAESAPVQK